MKETLTVEFKSDFKKYSDTDLFEDVVAFANTEGGDLYLGVEDDGTITGAHKNHANPVTLSAYIANNTVPPISTQTVIIEEEHPVLKISVPKSYGGIAETRMPAPEFDRRAFREAVVNVFSHRDYSIMGCVRMAVTEEGLTVANPDGLIEGVTVQNLLTAGPMEGTNYWPTRSSGLDWRKGQAGGSAGYLRDP